MTCDHPDRNAYRSTDYAVWYRKKQHWRIFAIGQLDICEEIVAKMRCDHPKRSILILPTYETPILGTPV
jgi:hypothetical protein